MDDLLPQTEVSAEWIHAREFAETAAGKPHTHSSTHAHVYTASRTLTYTGVDKRKDVGTHTITDMYTVYVQVRT